MSASGGSRENQRLNLSGRDPASLTLPLTAVSLQVNLYHTCCCLHGQDRAVGRGAGGHWAPQPRGSV